MATIREKRPGVWEVRVFTGRDKRGRPTQVSRTVRGGKRAAQKVAAELEAGPRSSAGGRTVADVLDEWVEANEATWTPATLRDQRSRSTLIGDDQIAHLPVARLSVGDVERWHLRMRRAGVGEGAIRGRHTALRAALTQAVRWGWASSNVAMTARLRSAKRPPRDAMTADDVRAILEAARRDRSPPPSSRCASPPSPAPAAPRSPRCAGPISTATASRSTAARVVEIVDGQRVPVDAPTKTANRRTVRLDAPTAELFDAQRRLREAISPYVFSLELGPANPDRIGWWWHRARELSGIDKRWRLHDLRHWAATVAIGSGADVRTVAGRLGHANPAMTLRVYAHAFEAADQALATTMGDLLDPNASP